MRVEYSDAVLTSIVERFCRDAHRRTGLSFGPRAKTDTSAADGAMAIRVELGQDSDATRLPDPAGLSPSGRAAADERYVLAIAADGITVRGPEPIGIARGLTSLTQLLATRSRNADGAIELPIARVLDGPRFAWRGFTLDVARHFFTVADVKRIIDLLMLYKFNVLHLHLTDDHAWRIAAGRPASIGESNGTYYKDSELRDLVAYAQARFITLVPEIDMPGHATAMVQLHAELDTGRNTVQLELAPGQIYHSAWLDPELPATYALMDKVLTRVASIFPGPWMHIGGDETFGMPEKLYVAFVRHARALVRSIGKRPLGWQEAMRAGGGSEDVIQYWMDAPAPDELPAVVRESAAKSPSDIARALECSVPVIVSPLSRAYFDVPYAERSADPTQEPWRRRVGMPAYRPRTVAESFDWEPASLLGKDVTADQIGGVGAAIWGETLRSFDDLAFLMLPRLAGTAEKSWSAPRSDGWSDHSRRLAAHGRLWSQDKLRYFRSSTVDWD